MDGVRRALPTARVGGPETAGGPGGKFLREFLTHCATGTNYVTGKTGSPLDFVSFHAKGSPVFTNGHVRMGMSSQFRNMNDAFAVIASFPQYKQPAASSSANPIPRAAPPAANARDAYRNGTMYSSYTAASFPREYELAAQHGVNLEGALTWAFEFEDQPPFAGFRQLAGDGHRPAGAQCVPHVRQNERPARRRAKQRGVWTRGRFSSPACAANPDVSALASLDNNKLAILVWHYHDDDVPGPDANVSLALAGLPSASGATLAQYRIDAAHSNSYTVWKAMGSPQTPSATQYAELEKAGQLAELEPAKAVNVTGGKLNLNLTLPRQAVSLMVLTWK